jgi:hypothetical protein
MTQFLSHGHKQFEIPTRHRIRIVIPVAVRGDLLPVIVRVLLQRLCCAVFVQLREPDIGGGGANDTAPA